MWLKLKQIACVASDLAAVEQEIQDILSVKVCYRDPGVAYFGLQNALFPIGNQLLEVVSPTKENTAAGRYLARRAGDGGYMVITQCDDHAPRRERVEELGIRVVHDQPLDDYLIYQLHPADTGGSFLEIDQQMGPNAEADDGPWHPAGADWVSFRDTSRVAGIVAAEIQCDEPETIASKWSKILNIPATATQDRWQITLNNADLRFVPCQDGRPEGLGGIDIRCVNVDAVMEQAERYNRVLGPQQILLCGLRMNLVD